MLAPNRIALYLGGLASLATALAPIVSDLDTSSTAGLIAGLAGLTGVISVWLNGWSRWETSPANPANVDLIEDEFEEGSDLGDASSAPPNS